MLPVDLFVEAPLRFMEPSPGLALPPLGAEVHAAAAAAMPGAWAPLERFAFYEAARGAFAVIQCLERRPYGCFLVQKGVVGPDGGDLRP